MFEFHFLLLLCMFSRELWTNVFILVSTYFPCAQPNKHSRHTISFALINWKEFGNKVPLSQYKNIWVNVFGSLSLLYDFHQKVLFVLKRIKLG